MEQEIWKDIPNYEGMYQVSNLGRVKSLQRLVKHWRGGDRIIKEKLLKITNGSKGYLQVCLSNKCIQEPKMVHVLVAISFLNHNSCGHKVVVDHINNDRSDNRLSNLQLISNRLNASKDRVNCSSKYTGVTWFNRDRKWKSQIWLKDRVLHLGYFETEIEASKAYQKKLKEINKQIK